MEFYGVKIYGIFKCTQKRKLCIPSIVNNSELIQLLKENCDKEDNSSKNNINNEIILNFENICSYEDINVLETYISNINKIQYYINLDINYHGNNLQKIMNYLIINEDITNTIEKYINMAKDISWDDLIDSRDMKDYFYENLISLNNRKEVSFFLFFNTFLKYRHEVSIDNFWRLVSSFNIYVENMNNLDRPLPKEYHLINIFDLYKNYDNDTIRYIKSLMFPESLYSFNQENYSFLNKMIELLKIENEYDKEEFKKFILTSPDIENVYFAGSSFLYFILNNFNEDINDIDIWMNLDKLKTVNFCSKFFSKTINSSDINHFSGKLRKGILDIEREKGCNLQFIHLDDKDGYDIIQTFDFPFLTGYFCIKNGKEELYMTTHCIETNYSKKVLRLYNQLCDKTTINFIKRLKKYYSRGYNFVGKFEDLINNNDINDDTIESFKKGTNFKIFKNNNSLEINYTYLNLFSTEYFEFNFKKYNYSFRTIFDLNLNNKNLLNNNSKNYEIFRKHFSKVVDILPNHRKHLCNCEFSDYFQTQFNIFSNFIFIDNQNGELINDCYTFEDLFDIDYFKAKYNLNDCYFQNNKIFFNQNY